MDTINWNYCQENSDSILLTGLNSLKRCSKMRFKDEFPNEFGNYLISDKTNNWLYTGESKTLSKRLNQHSKEKTSTFYKNYKKFEPSYPNYPQKLRVNNFQIRLIKTNIGRKELEEFGIENFPTNLNKFQRGKRNKYLGKTNIKIWKDIQSNYSIILEQGERILKRKKLYKWYESKIPYHPGLYWVINSSKELIYIGESSNIYDRYETHSGRTYFSSLRRQIGEVILGFKLQTINGRKRYFTDNEDRKVTNFLKTCSIRTLPINFGRYELEEFLIEKHNPLLNRKGNKR